MSHPNNTSAKLVIVEMPYHLPYQLHRTELADSFCTASVFTLLAFDQLNELVERESFYLSVYECPEDRNTEALAWRFDKEQAGLRVIRVDSLGEVTRI